MQKTIISDTSCIILLDKIGELFLLNALFGKIVVTPEIADEFKKDLPHWFEVKSASNKTYQKILEASLDRGEASAIALALEQADCLVIIDDYKGRKFAEQLGLNVTGTLGILVDAKLKGHVKSIAQVLEKIKSTNFRLDEELESIVLHKAGER